MTSELLEKTALQIFLQAGPPPFEEHHCIDLEEQLSVGRAVGEWCLHKNIAAGLVAFGYPGNGKRAFAMAICQDLFKNGYNILWLNARELLLYREDRLRRELARLRRMLELKELRPLLFVIDDLDVLETGESENPALAELRDPLRLSGSGAYAPPLVVLAVAVSPAIAIIELAPLYPALVYFDWPDDQKAATLLEALGVPKARDAATELIAAGAQNGVRYTTGSFVNAAKEALELAGKDSLGKLGSEEIAEALRHFCNPTANDKATEYEERHQSYMESARLLLREWLRAPSAANA